MIIDKIKERFGSQVEIFEKSATRKYVTVDKAEVKELMRYLFRELGGRFSTASGVDTRAAIEILYHMTFDQHNLIVTVRVRVNKPELEMPTLSDDVPATLWIEREIREMFGVNFIGHPQPETLLLPDDWEKGVYPLRKNTFESTAENTEREN